MRNRYKHSAKFRKHIHRKIALFAGAFILASLVTYIEIKIFSILAVAAVEALLDRFFESA